MLRSDRDRRRSRPGPRTGPQAALAPASNFVLYVEGPRDREILGCWARRVVPDFAQQLERNTVILGGRQPARAEADFRKRGGAAEGWSGLIVLDRDGDAGIPEAAEDNLEVFVWGRRHIESYLLVPSAIGRVLRLDPDDDRVERFVAEHLDDRLHAKRLLGAGGLLSEVLGTELQASAIARSMRVGDLHEDVRDLFARITARSGHRDRGPEVVTRMPRRR